MKTVKIISCENALKSLRNMLKCLFQGTRYFVKRNLHLHKVKPILYFCNQRKVSI